MKTIFISFSVITVLFFTSCGSTANHQGNTSKMEDTDSAATEALATAKIIKPSFVNTDPKLTTQVQHIYNAYLTVQSALANGKSMEAATLAKNMIPLVNSFVAAGLPADQKQVYETHAAKILESATTIGNTRDIKSQRITFATLSDHTYELVKAFGHNQPVYQAFCPMALNGKGAIWLSDKMQIRNPYYGDEMLECGEVINIVKK
jgi:hypothetical protein